MSDVEDTPRAVLGVLDDLREVVLNRDHTDAIQGPSNSSPIDIRPIWMRLELALHGAVDVMYRPQPGQGLASLWLEAVRQRAEAVEEVAENHSNGLSDLLWHDNDQLFWLGTNGWEAGNRILTFTGRRNREIRSLRDQQTRPLNRLAQLIADVDDDGQSPPVGLQDVGELILHAVNQLDIKSELLAEETFRKHILKHIDFPPAIASPPLLLDTSIQGLKDLVSRLSPETSLSEEEGLKKSYSCPRNYDRDKWIYEHVHLQDYQTLSKMLEKVCGREKWKFIDSRNGLKVAADRYADFHCFTRRRFPDDRTAN